MENKTKTKQKKQNTNQKNALRQDKGTTKRIKDNISYLKHTLLKCDHVEHPKDKKPSNTQTQSLVQ